MLSMKKKFNMPHHALLSLFAIVFCEWCFAAAFSGTVISVQKKGVLIIEESPTKKFRVKLLGVQNLGKTSEKEFQSALSAKLEKKKVMVLWERIDPLCAKYQKEDCARLGRVFIESRDIGQELISQGIAAYNKRDKSFLGQVTRRAYSQAQEKAFLSGLRDKN